MGLAIQAIQKQQRAYLGRTLQGLALFGIGAFASVQILRNGLGDLTVEHRGFGGKINELFLGLIERYPSAEGLLPIGMAALFAIIAAIGLYHVVRGGWQMSPKHTLMGKSILLQRKDMEDFGNTVDAINADLELEPYQFGSVYIGRHWILDIEAMRLERIKGMFWFDAGVEDHVLCCVDAEKNVWAASLRYAADRDKTAEHLRHNLPDLVMGDKDAHAAFLAGKEVPGKAQQVESIAVPTVLLPPDAVFSFVDADGRSTPEYTSDQAITALRGLQVSQSIAFRLEHPVSSTLNEVFFCRKAKHWNVGMCYTKSHERRQEALNVELPVAEQLLLGLILRNRLPNFACCQQV